MVTWSRVPNMDKAFAIDRFFSKFDGFSQLVFLTEEDILLLFGEEVAAALQYMEQHGARMGVCEGCGGQCCREIGCELYSTSFDSCPIHSVRPIVCRFHFCHKFDGAGKDWILALRDIYLGCHMAMDSIGNPLLDALDMPPLANAAPSFISAIDPLLRALGDGSVEPGLVREKLLAEAVKYRSRGYLS